MQPQKTQTLFKRIWLCLALDWANLSTPSAPQAPLLPVLRSKSSQEPRNISMSPSALSCNWSQTMICGREMRYKWPAVSLVGKTVGQAASKATRSLACNGSPHKVPWPFKKNKGSAHSDLFSLYWFSSALYMEGVDGSMQHVMFRESAGILAEKRILTAQSRALHPARHSATITLTFYCIYNLTVS